MGDGRMMLHKRSRHVEIRRNQTGALELVANNQVGIMEIFDAHPDAMEVHTPEPDPDCKQRDCYGRGYTGFNTTTGEELPCPKCLFPRTYEIPENVDAEDTATIPEGAEG